MAVACTLIVMSGETDTYTPGSLEPHHTLQGIWKMYTFQGILQIDPV